MASCIVAPVLVSIYLYDNYSKIKREIEWKEIIDRKREKLDQEDIDRIFYQHTHYRELFEHVDIRKKAAIFNPIIFMVRRAIFGITLVALDHFTLFQVWIALALNFIYIFYIAYWYPMKTRKNNRVEIFNESINMLVTYNFLMFTNFVYDLDARFYIGYVFIIEIIFLIIVNVYWMAVDQIHTYRFNKARKITQKRYEQQLKIAKANFKEQKRKHFFDIFESKKEETKEEAKTEEMKTLPSYRSRKRDAYNRMSHLISIKSN